MTMVCHFIQNDTDRLVAAYFEDFDGKLSLMFGQTTFAKVDKGEATRLRAVIDTYLNTSDLERGADADMVQF